MVSLRHVLTGYSVCTGSSSPEEMVTLLVQAGLFDTAVSLCQTFKLPLTPVFEGLAFKYVIHYHAFKVI